MTSSSFFHPCGAALIVLWLMTVSPVVAATKIWTGSSSGNWNTAANWSPSGVPGNGDDLLFPTGPTRRQITNNIVNLRLNQVTFSGTDYWLWGSPITLTNGIIAAQAGGFANIVGLTITNGANVTLNIVNPGAYLYMETNIVLGATTLTNTGSGLIYLDGVISGSGGLVKTGSGTNRMATSVGNSYTGATWVVQGTLVLDSVPSVQAIVGPLIIGDDAGGANADVVRLLNNRQIANRVPVTVRSSGRLDLSAGVSDAFGALSGSGNVVLSSATDLEVNYPDATSTFSGVISGSGRFWKDGSGTLTLTGNNTYTGATIVYANTPAEGGTLLVNGSQASSTVVISNGCTLGGSGIVGPVSVAAGATLSPGSSPGSLTCSSVTFNPGSILRVELNGAASGSTYDVLGVLNSVSLGNATLSATLGFGSTVSNTFTIINKVGAGAVSGIFSGLSSGSHFNISGVPFRIDYTGGTGNDVILTQLTPVASLVGALHVPRRDHTATLLPDGNVLIAGGTGNTGYTNSAELYDPARGTSSETDPLTIRRSRHTATLMPNGKVLVAGGITVPGLSTNGVEFYDPTSRTWTTTNALNAARESHTATLLADGTLLVAGGFDTHEDPISSSECYNPLTGNWLLTASPMNTVRGWHTATLLPDGKVLVTGGLVSYVGFGGVDTAELYNPGTGNWTMTTSPMHTARYQHTAILLANGKVLVAGGYGTNGATAACEVFDPNTGTWTQVGELNIRRHEHTATLLPSGKVLVVGGRNSSDGTICSAELFDPLTGSWTTNGIGLLVQLRESHTATLLPSGKVLVAGGYISSPLVTVEEYNSPAFGHWTMTGLLKTNRYHHTATLLPNGRVLVAGGTDPGAPSSEWYDPDSGHWTNTGNLNAEREYHTATLLPSGKVLVAGGYNTTQGKLSSAELFDPATALWSSISSMSTQRQDHTTTLLSNGKVLVAGGRNNINRPPIAELFDPVTGTWTNTGSMVNPRYHHTATLLPNGKVLIAGGHGSSPTSGTELYNPVTGIFAASGPLLANRYLHTATLLPNGKVLVVGGYTNSILTLTAELYDPVTETWTNTTSLSREHHYHTATLLPNGKVLIAGNNAGMFGAESNAELYDPATGLWTLTNAFPSRFAHTATLLPNGKILTAGGIGQYGPTNRADLYEVGLGFSNSWQPQISAMTSPVNLGDNLALTGAKFRGISGASGGNGQNSASDYPLVQLMNLQNQQTLFLPTTSWSSNLFLSAPVTNFPPGHALVTIFVNGIPSTSAILRVTPAPVAVLLTEARQLPGGAFQFAFTNISGANFTVLATTNVGLPVSNWSLLGGVMENPPSQFQFIDHQTTNDSRRFYRVRSP